MNSIIENLEKKVQDTAGLTVLEKRNDGFAYSIAVQRGDDIFVVYTTYGIQHYKKENCLVVFQVTEHIPFTSVNPTQNGDFISPYLGVILKKRVRVGNEMYGVQVNELPIFLKAS